MRSLGLLARSTDAHNMIVMLSWQGLVCHLKEDNHDGWQRLSTEVLNARPSRPSFAVIYH